jgi:hypothetical protein
VDIRSFEELRAPDPRSLSFTPYGLGPPQSPEYAARFQQESIAAADLVESVPNEVRGSFERLRALHAQGVLFYPAFTLVTDLRWVVLEQALRERFIALYDNNVKIERKKSGQRDVIHATNFVQFHDVITKGPRKPNEWGLILTSGEVFGKLPVSLGGLLRWARAEGLLDGQRNRRVQEAVFSNVRNRFAHGGYHLGMPPQSAQAICDLAEIINRLWGSYTPGGRLYPAPLQREVLVIWWREEDPGSGLYRCRPDQLANHEAVLDWRGIAVRAVPHDPDLFEFDARCERTSFPTDILWGPGTRAEVERWLAARQPLGDTVQHLDRLFLVRRDADKVFIPCRPETFLAVPAIRKAGRWHAVKADFPNDAFAHVRHIHEGQPCGDNPCPVEDLLDGTWEEMVQGIHWQLPNLQPIPWSDVTVPPLWDLPDSIGL